MLGHKHGCLFGLLSQSAPPAIGKTGQRTHRKSLTTLFFHQDKMLQHSFGGHSNAYHSLFLTDNAYLVRRCSFMHDATGCASKNVAGKSNAMQRTWALLQPVFAHAVPR